MARGRGMSQYAGLRVSLMQTPGSDMAQVLVRSKAPSDGWDEYSHVMVSEQIFCGSVTSSLSALEVACDFLSELLHELQKDRWGPE